MSYEMNKQEQGYPPVQHVSAAQAPPPGAIIMTQEQYNATYGAQAQQQVHYVQQPQQPVQTAGGQAMTGPPRGKWRDGIFDCGANLWPSCCCVWACNGIGAAWVISQISQKTGYSQFNSIMKPFAFVYVIAWILYVFIQPIGNVIFWLLGLSMVILAVFLRMHVARTYEINDGACTECLTGFFCAPCSVSQMARHVYGYTKVWDGDSDPEVKDHYQPAQGLNGDVPSNRAYAGTGTQYASNV